MSYFYFDCLPPEEKEKQWYFFDKFYGKHEERLLQQDFSYFIEVYYGKDHPQYGKPYTPLKGDTLKLYEKNHDRRTRFSY